MIEDNPDHAFLAETCLTQYNADVVVECADNAEHALAELDRVRGNGGPLPDLLLLDLNMPGMNGVDFLRQTKAHDRFRLIPTVVVSSSTNPADVTLALAHHANSYVAKTVDFVAWERTLTAVCAYWRDQNCANRIDAHA